MAQIVVGAAIPRGPQLFQPPSGWAAFGERDRNNPWLFDVEGRQTSFDELLRRAPSSIEEKLQPELWERQHAAARRAHDQVRDAFEQANPDVVVVMGDDERELFLDDATRPRVAIYRGADWVWGEDRANFPVAVDLVDWVIERLRDAGYQPQVIDALPEAQLMPHSFGL